MKRIGILTAGGDTPALNATINGAVVRANQLKIEIYGFIKGFNCFFNPRMPHVHLNPLFQSIPELDPMKGGTLIGSSRDYVDADKGDELDLLASRLKKLGIDGLIAIGGDGTLNGLQPLAERLPTVLAPKTIDNDLGLNYPSESDEWMRIKDPETVHGYRYKRSASDAVFNLDHIVNYVTPGYATAVMVTAQGVERVTGEREGGHDASVTKMLPLSLAATHAICQGAEGGWRRERLTRSQMYPDHADCSETNRHDTHGDQADRDHPDRCQAKSDKANCS